LAQNNNKFLLKGLINIDKYTLVKLRRLKIIYISNELRHNHAFTIFKNCKRSIIRAIDPFRPHFEQIGHFEWVIPGSEISIWHRSPILRSVQSFPNNLRYGKIVATMESAGISFLYAAFKLMACVAVFDRA